MTEPNSPALPDMFREFQELIIKLREECPWDKKQTHESLKRHLLEEAYEVLDAIDGLSEDGKNDSAGYEALKDELGDLLYQVFFHSLLAGEAGKFEIEDVIKNIYEKLYRRHPHVFGDLEIETTEELAPHWEEIKKSEKDTESVMDKLPEFLPALLLASKVQKKARALDKSLDIPGYADSQAAADQIKESLKKLDASSQNKAESSEAIGELLWAVTALAVEQELDTEDILRQKAKKFADSVRQKEIDG